MSYNIVCDVCGMELDIDKFDKQIEEFKGGTIKVLSFACPKCDEVYIVSVFDSESDRLRDEWKAVDFQAVKGMRDGAEKDEKIRLLLKEKAARKRAMVNYNNRLKKSYIKEMKRHGKR